MKARWILLSLAVVAVGCASPEGMNSASVGSAPAMDAVATKTSMPQEEAARVQLASRPEIPVERQVIRRAELAVRVPNVEKAESEVNGLVRGWQGYVESASSSDLATDFPVLNMALRVPVGRFDEAIAKLESLGVRLNKTVSSEDVTAQLVDLDARLKTLRAQEETYRGLLRKSTNLQSVISLQDKLTEVRSTIESMAAQRKTLGGLAAMSSVSLRLEQDAVAHSAPKDPNWLAQTWGQSTTALGYALRGLANVAIYMVVFSPLWLPLAWLFWRAARPMRKPSQV